MYDEKIEQSNNVLIIVCMMKASPCKSTFSWYKKWIWMNYLAECIKYIWLNYSISVDDHP